MRKGGMSNGTTVPACMHPFPAVQILNMIVSKMISAGRANGALKTCKPPSNGDTQAFTTDRVGIE